MWVANIHKLSITGEAANTLTKNQYERLADWVKTFTPTNGQSVIALNRDACLQMLARDLMKLLPGFNFVVDPKCLSFQVSMQETVNDRFFTEGGVIYGTFYSVESALRG